MSQNIDPIVSFVCQTATHAIEVRMDRYQHMHCIDEGSDIRILLGVLGYEIYET